MAEFKDFINENVAPFDVRRIGIYNAQGNRVGQIQLGRLTFPDAGAKSYSFAAFADIHVGYDTAVTKLQRALTFVSAEGVAFTCLDGDLTGVGSNEQLSQLKSIVEEYSSNAPVYAIAGNHEGMTPDVENRIATYTGHQLYYSFTHGNDVFIMVGVIGGDSVSNGVVFADGELQWLYETLEANRNKRCFVFQHIFAGVEKEPVCGNAKGIYTNWCWHNTSECNVFESLMLHYKNVVWFHAHSHLRFSLQGKADYANYSSSDGYKSVHIPSLTVLRCDSNNDGTAETDYTGSEGYVVDVYKNGIHLRGRDFVKGEFLPIASYWLDTTLQTVAAGTYTDSTGTIVT
ncbi:MAG: metallophosphoesterase [Bacteroidaceae bacterium]|nr:metallophosphoesterase [Bacteroidaceae bacterium]